MSNKFVSDGCQGKVARLETAFRKPKALPDITALSMSRECQKRKGKLKQEKLVRKVVERKNVLRLIFVYMHLTLRFKSYRADILLHPA